MGKLCQKNRNTVVVFSYTEALEDRSQENNSAIQVVAERLIFKFNSHFYITERELPAIFLSVSFFILSIFLVI